MNTGILIKLLYKQNNLTGGHLDIGIVRLRFQSVTYTQVFIYNRFTIVYDNIYSDGAHANAVKFVNAICLSSTSPASSHFSYFSYLEGFPHIACLYHGNTIGYFVQKVPGGMTYFVLGIDR